MPDAVASASAWRALRPGVELVAHTGAQDQLGRHVHPRGGARIRFARNGAAQPDHQPVLLGEPADHEQTHMTRGVGSHLATGLQAGVGDPQIGFGHAEPDVADLDDQPAVSGVHGRHPHLRDRRRVAQRVVQQLGEQVHEIACHRSDDLAVGHRRGDDAGVVLDLGGGRVDRAPRRAPRRPARAAPSHRTSTNRLAPFRRIRAARWSSLNKLSSRSGSSSLRSSRSMSESCWSTSERLRRDSVSNMSPTCSCSRLCSPARKTACSCSSSTAWATWPTSSVVCTGIGSTGPGSLPARTRSISRARSSCATRRALSRSVRSGRTSDRATRMTSSRASSIAASTIAESRMASVRAAEASVVDGAGYRGHRAVDHPGRDLIGGLQRRGHVRVVDQRHGRVGDECGAADVLGLQLLGLRRADRPAPGSCRTASTARCRRG